LTHHLANAGLRWTLKRAVSAGAWSERSVTWGVVLVAEIAWVGDHSFRPDCRGEHRGPALAYWLDRYGWRTKVVEQAPSLRTGGQNADLKDAGLQVVARMGLEEEVRAAFTGEEGLEFVGSRGQVNRAVPGRGRQRAEPDLGGGDPAR